MDIVWRTVPVAFRYWSYEAIIFLERLIVEVSRSHTIRHTHTHTHTLKHTVRFL